MTNTRADPIDATFTISKDGETVYDRTHRLQSMSDGQPGTVEIVKEWMGEKVDYEVTVSVTESALRTSFSTDDATEFISEWGEKDCFSLSVTPGTDDLYFAIGAMEACPG